MPSDSPRRRLPAPDARSVTIYCSGEAVAAREGDSVAAALLAAGLTAFRDSPVSGTPRVPFCMMGACFDCLLEIDGQPNSQACMVPVREGLRVAPMAGARAAAAQERDETS